MSSRFVCERLICIPFPGETKHVNKVKFFVKDGEKNCRYFTFLSAAGD